MAGRLIVESTELAKAASPPRGCGLFYFAPRLRCIAPPPRHPLSHCAAAFRFMQWGEIADAAGACVAAVVEYCGENATP